MKGLAAGRAGGKQSTGGSRELARKFIEGFAPSERAGQHIRDAVFSVEGRRNDLGIWVAMDQTGDLSRLINRIGRHVAQPKAYFNARFIESRDARALRILAEYLEPMSRFQRRHIQDTIVFMGSARIKSREDALAAVAEAEKTGIAVELARTALELSQYYEAARTLASRLTEWSKNLADEDRRFVICTGGGPGIMEAANRGASEAKGHNIGLTISIPNEEFDNSYISRELHLHFHYFFMRKFWFIYLAKAVVLFPGGFGTLDELFEILTLVQTRKMRKRIPIILFGQKFWSEIINFNALVRYGTISPEDVDLFHFMDSIDDAYTLITRELIENSIAIPGPVL